MGLASARTVITDRNIQITDPDTGLEWYLRTPLPFSAIVGIEDGKVKAYDWKGNLIAKGKAGVDDARVIQVALDSLTSGRTWKERVVLMGEFKITETIKLADYTILDLSSAILELEADVNMIENEDQANGNDFIDIIGDRLEGKSSERISGKLINFNEVYNSKIVGTFFTNSKEESVFLDHTYKFEILACIFYRGGGHIRTGTCSDIIITNNYFLECGSDFIALRIGSAGADFTIIGNDFYNNFGRAVDIRATAVFEGNIVNDNGEHGIVAVGSSDTPIIIKNNLVFRNDGYGIVVSGSDVTVEGNILNGNTNGPISVTGNHIIKRNWGTPPKTQAQQPLTEMAQQQTSSSAITA